MQVSNLLLVERIASPKAARNDAILSRQVSAGRRIIFAGGYFASPVLANGRIYAASDRGVVTVVASGDKPDVLARNDLNERVSLIPVS